MLTNLLLVGTGGAIGAILRFFVSEAMPSDGFPWGTLTVNLVGSVLLGVLTAAVAVHAVSETQALLLGVGLLGAFTTMSTFSLETAMLFDEGRWTSLFLYVLLSGVAGPLLALAGWKGSQQWLA